MVELNNINQALESHHSISLQFSRYIQNQPQKSKLNTIRNRDMSNTYTPDLWPAGHPFAHASLWTLPPHCNHEEIFNDACGHTETVYFHSEKCDNKNSRGRRSPSSTTPPRDPKTNRTICPETLYRPTYRVGKCSYCEPREIRECMRPVHRSDPEMDVLPEEVILSRREDGKSAIRVWKESNQHRPEWPVLD